MKLNQRGVAPILIIVAILALLTVSGTGYYFVEKNIEQKQSNNNLAICSPVNFSGYELVKGGDISIDLNNDGVNEIVRGYSTPSGDDGGKVGPNLIKIFTNDVNCPKELLSYTGQGNFIWKMQKYDNFFGDSYNVVALEDVEHGMGCGGTIHLLILAYRNGEYVAIKGLSTGSYDPYMFAGENGLGSKIIMTDSVWDDDYCCGCKRKLQFSINNWNGQEYVKKGAGATQNKYDFDNQNIEDILKKESESIFPTNPPIIDAVKAQNLEEVKRLIESGAKVDVNEVTNYLAGDTALMLAVSSGNLRIVQELIKAGADLNVREEGGTALMIAAESDNLEIVQELIKAGADVNIGDMGNYIPLTVSDSEIMRELIKAGADVNAATNTGEHNAGTKFIPLNIAAYRGDLELVKEIIKAGAWINSQDYFGMTALMVAAQHGYPEIVQELIKAGADVNIVMEYTGDYSTALSLAISNNHLDVADILRKAGAK